MKKEIEIAQLVHNFVRDNLSDKEMDKLFTLLDEDPNLMDYIMTEFMIYEYGLRKKDRAKL